RPLRHSPFAGRGREPLRRADPILRRQAHAPHRPAPPLPRGDADLRRGGPPAAPPRVPEGARRDGRRRPARGLPRARGVRPPVSAGRRILRLGLLLVALALAVAAYLYQQLEHPSPAAPGSEVTLFFPLGTPTTDIFRRLAGEGVLKFPRLAEAY